MAVSIANTLTSRLWRGEPKVVIRGKFALGLVADGNYVYFAPSLWFPRNMAVPRVSGTGISVQVLGRAVQAGADPDSSVYVTDPGIRGGAMASFQDMLDGAVSPSQSVRDLVSPYVPSSPYSDQDEGPYCAPKIVFHPRIDESFDKTSQGAANAKSRVDGLGTVVAPDLQIVLRGALESLNIEGITALGFPSDSTYTQAYGLTYKASTNLWDSQYYSSPPSFSPAGVGWRPTDVHVYDSPWLRGHVTAGNVPVIWE